MFDYLREAPGRVLWLLAALTAGGLLAFGATPFPLALGCALAACAALFVLMLLPAAWRQACWSYFGWAPGLLLALIVLLLALRQAPPGWLWGVSRYSYALDFGLAVLGAILLTYALPVRARRALSDYLVRPAAIFLLIIFLALGVLQAPRRASFQARITSDQVALTAGEAEARVECPRLDLIVPPSDCTRVVVPPTAVNDHTTLALLKGRPIAPDGVTFEPLPGSAGQASPPFYSLKIQFPPSPQGPPEPAATLLRLKAPQGVGRLLVLQRDRDGDHPFEVRWQAPQSVEVEGVTAYELYVRNCQCTSEGRTVPVGDTAEVLSGKLLSTGPVVLDLGATSDRPLELYLPGGGPKLAAVSFGDKGRLSDPAFGRLRGGKVVTEMVAVLGLKDKGTVEWKEKEDIVPQVVEIDGAGGLAELELRPDGLHALVKGEATSVKADGSEQLNDWLSVLLKANAFLAIGAFIAWSVDKIFSYLSMRQATATPPPPGPGPAATGS